MGHLEVIGQAMNHHLQRFNSKYETLLDDSTLALHTINASHIQFPRLDHTSGTAEKLHRYFSQLDLPLIRRLYKLYKHDYRIFNYNLDNINGRSLSSARGKELYNLHSSVPVVRSIQSYDKS
ncbi:hypothetical protein SFRURICE_020670 [Spodoptera frugiperda]|nr:hypothetical protein SFRURICE_020670 [Spodoptera frugiperda]